MARLRRTISLFIAEMRGGPETPFEFHVLAVYLDMKQRKARISWIKNVVL